MLVAFIVLSGAAIIAADQSWPGNLLLIFVGVTAIACPPSYLFRVRRRRRFLSERGAVADHARTPPGASGSSARAVKILTGFATLCLPALALLRGIDRMLDTSWFRPGDGPLGGIAVFLIIAYLVGTPIAGAVALALNRRAALRFVNVINVIAIGAWLLALGLAAARSC